MVVVLCFVFFLCCWLNLCVRLVVSVLVELGVMSWVGCLCRIFCGFLVVVVSSGRLVIMVFSRVRLKVFLCDGEMKRLNLVSVVCIFV